MLKNITLSAEERDIALARKRASEEHTTINELFREWLAEYARRDQLVEEAMAAIDELTGLVHIGGRKFSREEMNER